MKGNGKVAREKCIIFDLDDTLIDSETICNRVFLDLIPELICDLGDLVEENRGRKLDSIIESIEQKIGKSLPLDFEIRYRNRVKQLFDVGLKPNKGVRDALDHIAYPKCVASSGPLSKIRHALRVTNLTSYFENNIFSSYEIKSWKPEPDIFLHAARMMNYEIRDCIVVEDSRTGVEAARAAGMAVVHYRKDQNVRALDEIVSFDDMADLPVLIRNML